jgi:hypothetical protein
MTLLFFLRSPGGNTDTGKGPDAGLRIDYEELPARKNRKAERKAARLAVRKLALAAEVAVADKKRKRRKDEELLLMLFMHEFEGYDD